MEIFGPPNKVPHMMKYGLVLVHANDFDTAVLGILSCIKVHQNASKYAT